MKNIHIAIAAAAKYKYFSNSGSMILFLDEFLNAVFQEFYFRTKAFKKEILRKGAEGI